MMSIKGFKWPEEAFNDSLGGGKGQSSPPSPDVAAGKPGYLPSMKVGPRENLSLRTGGPQGPGQRQGFWGLPYL